MEITARLTDILPEQSGQGRNGVWRKISFVVETQDQYPRKICFDVWGDKIDDIKQLQAGDMLKVEFDVESREYNGRWYTNVKAWRVEKQNAGGESAAGTPANPPLPDFEEPAAPASETGEITDDLPF